MKGTSEGLDLLGRAKALLCVSVDPWLPPQGGQTTFARHLLSAFKTDLAVVSTCAQRLPVRSWVARDFEGSRLAFFSLGVLSRMSGRKPLIPGRISVYFKAARGMAEVHRSGIPNIFVDDPELLLAASRYEWGSVCYNIAGVFNPAALSRYRAARPLAHVCQTVLVRAIRKLEPSVILAAGDGGLVESLRGIHQLENCRIEPLPTRVNLDRFYPEPRHVARERLALPAESTILVAVGRLCWIKGWSLLLSALRTLKRTAPRIMLLFVGDGEDRDKLLAEAQQQGVSENIRITGFVPPDTVRNFLNASDVYLVGSYSEGWSVAMLEALACGKPIVSTRVSGTRDMISIGANGYVVDGRDPDAYAAAVCRAMTLRDVEQISRGIAARYSMEGLARDLRAKWPVLQERAPEAGDESYKRPASAKATE